MFYDKYKVNNVLLCKNCQEQLDEPKILPCGKTVCSLCASKIKMNGNEFDCLLCKNKHEMPKNGLPNNEALLEMLSVKPTSVSRGTAYDLLDNSSDFINEHCIELRSDVQLRTEEVILQVNDFSSKIIEEIDDYEKELIEFNKTNNSVSLDEFNQMVIELESFYNLKADYLKQYKVNDESLIKSNKEATSLIKKAEQELQKLKDVIFDEKIFIFEKNSDKVNISMLGKAFRLTGKIDSAIVSDKNQASDLLNLCEFPVYQKWTLIYRASQDGFKSSDFHSKCDDKPITLVIIKSLNGNVFGGYTEKSWGSSINDEHGVYKYDPNAFIFSLINKENKPLKMKCIQPDTAIYCSTRYGPYFGVSDLEINDNSNVNIESYANLGYSYEHPDYEYRSDEADSFLAGSNYFQVSEIEVFIKLKEN